MTICKLLILDEISKIKKVIPFLLVCYAFMYKALNMMGLRITNCLIPQDPQILKHPLMLQVHHLNHCLQQ